ncbi:hypothetical protein KCU90_g743, partial [Aureobasidium melanogenum]
MQIVGKIQRRAKQTARVGMLRLRKEPSDRRFLHLLAREHHGDTIRVARDNAKVVRNQQQGHRQLATQTVEQVENARLNRDVERRGRLVGNQQTRPAGNRHRDHHALPLAAGQLVRKVEHPPLRLRNPHQFEQLHGTLPCRGFGQALMLAQGLDDLRADRQHGIERRHRLLEDHRNLLPANLPNLARRQIEQLTTVEAQAPRHTPRRRHKTHQRKRRRRFAATRFADQCQRLAVRDVETQAAHRFMRAETDARCSGAFAQARVERIVQTVTKQVQRKHRENDRRAGNRGQIPCGAQRIATGADHTAPTHHVRVAHAEKRQRRLDQDRARHHYRCGDDHRRQSVRQNFTEDDARVAESLAARGKHEIRLAQRTEFSTHDPRNGRPRGDADCERDDRHARPADRHNHDHQQKRRHRLKEFGHAYQQIVDHPAEEAPGRPDQRADHEADTRRRRADQQRHACAVRDARRHIAAQRIRAEPIDQHIGDDHEQRRQQQHAEQHAEIARHHGVERETPKPWPTEHRLGHSRTTQQRAEMNPNDRRERHQRVPQDMPHRHAPWMQTFGLRGSHEVLALHLQHRGPGEPCVDRDKEGRQRRGRQQHMFGCVGKPGESMQLHAERDVAPARQPAQMYREQHDRQQADPETRCRIEQQGQHGQHPVGPFTGPMRHHRAEHHAGHDRER